MKEIREMRLITVAGPPSVGKTSVILKTVEHLKKEGKKIGIIKFDALLQKMTLPMKRWDCRLWLDSLEIYVLTISL